VSRRHDQVLVHTRCRLRDADVHLDRGDVEDRPVRARVRDRSGRYDQHRGEPDVSVNPDDAAARGVKDDDLIRVFNDVSSFKVRAKVAPNVKPGQLISYNGWGGFQYTDWSGANEIEPGMVKWIGLAGGYGHLRHLGTEWQPVPSDRWVRCDFEKVN